MHAEQCQLGSSLSHVVGWGNSLSCVWSQLGAVATLEGTKQSGFISAQISICEREQVC